ncbi:MAG: hypothetical protein MJZ62_07600 [Bacteroidales bacterium]|nr:hypothetical protein [Bacteroidales bacterium]MCQ2278803.1 hypothetical protein [Bacteroidales bacterium]MCQ2279149.1 hypothetical protein [Bacteroidales bacterium]
MLSRTSKDPFRLKILVLFPIMEGYSFTDYDSNFAEEVAQTDQVVGNSNSSTWDFAQDKDGF